MTDASKAPRPSRRYWLCHGGGWSAWAALSAPLAPTVPLVAITIAAMVSTHQFRNLVHRWGWRQMPLRRLAPRVLLASMVCGAIMTAANAPWTVGQVSAGQQYVFFGSFSGISFGWFVLYFGFHFRERVREAEAQRWRYQVHARDAELAARTAELSALRAQLNPHFLFNALNGLRGLIAVDPDRARFAVTELSELLRFTLRMSERRTTPLGAELEAVGHYLALEQIRFGDRLAYSIDADPDTLACAVPPMLVQTLVENGIKHGIGKRPEGGYVRVAGVANAEEVVVRVVNSGALDREAAKSGVGLTNARRRLRLLFQDRARLELRESGPDEVTAELALPTAAADARAREEPAAATDRTEGDSP